MCCLLVQDAFAEREQLTLINANLQRKVINFKERDKKKKTDEEVNAENKAAATSDNMKTAYLQLLQETFSVRDKIKSRQVSNLTFFLCLCEWPV
jgi:rRNA maturation protein Rpf1